MSMLWHSRSLLLAGKAGVVISRMSLARRVALQAGPFKHRLVRSGCGGISTDFSSLSRGVSQEVHAQCSNIHSRYRSLNSTVFKACAVSARPRCSPAWHQSRVFSSEPSSRQPLKKVDPSSFSSSSPSSSVSKGQAKAPEGEEKEEVEELYYTFGPLRMRQVNANFPNFLTVVRIAMALPVGYLFYTGHHELAFYGFFVAGACDFFDGYFARKWNQKTVLGAMLDPAADKLLVASLALPMAVTGAIPLWLCALIVGRDTPGSFLFDTKEVNFTVEATNLSKLNMALQSLLIMSTLTHAAFEFPAVEPLSYLQYTVGATTAGSWLQYAYMFFYGDAYKNRDDVK